MIQCFINCKITSCAFILCLFGLTLITVSPVFADDPEAFVECQKIKPDGSFEIMKQKKNCFRDLARKYEDENKVIFKSAIDYAFAQNAMQSEISTVVDALRKRGIANEAVRIVTNIRMSIAFWLGCVNAHPFHQNIFR